MGGVDFTQKSQYFTTKKYMSIFFRPYSDFNTTTYSSIKIDTSTLKTSYYNNNSVWIFSTTDDITLTVTFTY